MSDSHLSRLQSSASENWHDSDFDEEKEMEECDDSDNTGPSGDQLESDEGDEITTEEIKIR